MWWQMSRMQIRWSYLFRARNRYIVAIYGKIRSPVICCQQEVRRHSHCSCPVPVMATVPGVTASVHTVSLFLFPLPSLSQSKYILYAVHFPAHFFRRITNYRLARSFLPSFFHTRIPTTISNPPCGVFICPSCLHYALPIKDPKCQAHLRVSSQRLAFLQSLPPVLPLP